MTKKTPRLSVIIPVYNARQYLKQCIGTVLRQEVGELEVICVDDGSTDGSLELLRLLEREHPRLRVFAQENRSAGAARNLGLAHARGEYVHFLDADDYLAPGIYPHVLKLLESSRADVCLFQYSTLDNATGEVRRQPCLLDYEGKVLTFHRKPAFFLCNMVSAWNKVYRRSFLEAHALRFDEVVCGNDRGFYFSMLAAGGRMVLSSACGVFYRVNNAASLTGSNRWRHFDSLFTAWETSEHAMAGETEEIRAMLLDCVLRDLLAVFRAAPPEHREEAARVLGERLRRTDFSIMSALPYPCTWAEEAEQLCRGGVPDCVPVPLMQRLRISLWIWGLRGLLVRLRPR